MVRQKAILFLLALLVIGSAHAAWWNSSFESCRNIDLTIQDSVNHTTQPYEINITGLTDQQTNSTDVRIINQGCRNDGSIIEYSLIANGTNWATVALVGNFSNETNFSVYWKNNTFVLPQAKPAALLLQDEFNSQTFNDTGYWNVSTEAQTDGCWNYSQINGQLNITCRSVNTLSAAKDGIATVHRFGMNITVETALKMNNTNNLLLNIIGIQGSNAFTSPYVLISGNRGGPNSIRLSDFNDPTNNFTDYAGGYIDNVFNNFSVQTNTSYSAGFINATHIDTVWTGNSTTVRKVSIGGLSSQDQVLNFTIDYVRIWSSNITKLYAVKPTYTLGITENQSNYTFISITDNSSSSYPGQSNTVRHNILLNHSSNSTFTAILEGNWTGSFVNVTNSTYYNNTFWNASRQITVAEAEVVWYRVYLYSGINSNLSNNFTYTVRNSNATIDLVSLSDGITVSDSTPSFTFFINDTNADTLGATLWINRTKYGFNNSIFNATLVNITANTTLNDSYYTWFIEFNDSTQALNSSTRTFTLQRNLTIIRAPSVDIASQGVGNPFNITVNVTASDWNISTVILTIRNESQQTGLTNYTLTLLSGSVNTSGIFNLTFTPQLAQIYTITAIHAQDINSEWNSSTTGGSFQATAVGGSQEPAGGGGGGGGISEAQLELILENATKNATKLVAIDPLTKQPIKFIDIQKTIPQNATGKAIQFEVKLSKAIKSCTPKTKSLNCAIINQTLFIFVPIPKNPKLFDSVKSELIIFDTQDNRLDIPIVVRLFNPSIYAIFIETKPIQIPEFLEKFDGTLIILSKGAQNG